MYALILTGPFKKKKSKLLGGFPLLTSIVLVNETLVQISLIYNSVPYEIKFGGIFVQITPLILYTKSLICFPR